MKKIFKVAYIVLALVTLLAAFPPAPAHSQAAETWQEAYTRLLRGYMGVLTHPSGLEHMNGEFILYDLDKDGVPELIVSNWFHRSSYIAAYTFKGGRVQQLSFEGIGFCSLVFAPAGNAPGLITIQGEIGVTLTTLWAISDNSLVAVTSVLVEMDIMDGDDFYWAVDWRDATREEYERVFDSVFGDINRLQPIPVHDISDSNIRQAISAVQPPLTVLFDGRPMVFDVPPQIINGSTMVPMRAIFDALGAAIAWDGDTSTITATRGATVVILTVDSRIATVNGNAVELNEPAVVINGRALVPIRFVSDALGAAVGWDGSTRTVSITR